MIPLDLSCAASTPKRPDDDRPGSDDSPQKVPTLSDRDEDCRCYTPDVEAMTSTRSACRVDRSLRPRLGRVQRVSIQSTRQRRCRQSQHCVDTVVPADESTPSDRSQVNTPHTASGVQQMPVDLPKKAQLPIDPRQWSRDDVHSWVRQTSLNHKIAATDDVIADRFPMNGKALCLMANKPEMFLRRVPVGGLVLFHDFRSLLLHALAADNASLMRSPSYAR